MAEIENKLVDRRTVARYLRKGIVDEKDYERFLKSLPDLADQARALALAAVPALASAIRRMDLAGSITIDFPTLSDKADFKVRFFTPNTEVDLCGHATIGSFSALHEEGRLDAARSVFTQETKAGVLEVERSFRDGRPVFTMTQAKPRYPLPQ